MQILTPSQMFCIAKPKLQILQYPVTISQWQMTAFTDLFYYLKCVETTQTACYHIIMVINKSFFVFLTLDFTAQ